MEIKERLKFAYQSLLIVSLNQPPGEFYKNFSDQVKQLSLRNYNYTYNEQMANYFTASFHDSVILLCKALFECQQNDKKFYYKSIEYIREEILKKMKQVTFLGISGNVTIVDGDRIADYALLDQTDPESGLFEVCFPFNYKHYNAIINFSRLPFGIMEPRILMKRLKKYTGLVEKRQKICRNAVLMEGSAKVR